MDLLFPRRCVACGAFGSYLCSTCQKRVRPIPHTEAICVVCGRRAFEGKTHPYCRGKWTPDGLTSFFVYEGTIRAAVHAVKYRGVTASVSLLMTLVSKRQWKAIPSCDVLCPIPLHWKRSRMRGFNQATYLAREMSACVGAPVDDHLLSRVIATKPQALTTSQRERSANLTRVFHAAPCKGARIILVDDVCTSGATIRDATRALKQSGAAFVWAVTLAR